MNTIITPPLGHAARLAAPFSAHMRPVKPIEMVALTGVAAIPSVVADMPIFPRALLNPNSPVARPEDGAFCFALPGKIPG